MSADLFPSGQWVGFYTYGGRSRKYLMDLVLEFKNGVLTGEGHDGIGAFVISGLYSGESLECHWEKTYVGRHTVDYRGFRENKGIWGTWTVGGGKGGFHIWPLADGSPLPSCEEEDSVEKPETTVSVTRSATI